MGPDPCREPSVEVILFGLLFSRSALPLRLTEEDQEAAPAPFAASPKLVTLDYPDNTRGLEHLAKDIMNAKEEASERVRASPRLCTSRFGFREIEERVWR